MSKIANILGPKFKGTLIEDSLLEPYFITKDSGGGFTVSKLRTSSKGELKFTDVCYPGSFLSCLDHIAKAKLNESGKVYESVNSYIEQWKEICDEIRNLYKKWNVNQL